MSEEFPAVEKGTYQEGYLYEVLGVALQAETNEPLIIYRPLYENEYEFLPVHTLCL